MAARQNWSKGGVSNGTFMRKSKAINNLINKCEKFKQKNHRHGINSPLTKLSFSIFFFEIDFEISIFENKHVNSP